METYTYLQTAWGDQWDNITIDIVRTAIEEIKKMDDEHDAFWVGLVKEDENVLEVHKNLNLICIFEDEPEVEYKGYAKNWAEVDLLFEAFLADKMEIVKAKLTPDK